VFICARNERDLSDMEETLNNLNPKARLFTMPCDVSQRDQVEAFADFCLSQVEHFDVLINNAGVFIPGRLHDEPEGRMETMMATNLFSAYYLSRRIIPGMKSKRTGHVINICSVASSKAYPDGGAYSVSKHALLGLSRNLREELKEDGIRVTSVLPGATLTASWDGIDLPEERFIPATDVAQLILGCIESSDRTVVEDLVIRPQLGDL
jgi:short-subunit dehydrogenase